MPKPICASSCVSLRVLKTPQEWKREIESDWNNNVDAAFKVSRKKERGRERERERERERAREREKETHSAQAAAFSPSPACTLTEQDLISLDYSRRLVNSKHNQTLWSVSAARNWKHIVQSFFGGKNLQLPSACECSLRWNFSISSLHSSCPPSKANRQRQRHSRPCHPRTAGGSFQAAVNSSFFVWEKIHVHTNRRCSDFFFFFLKHHNEKGGRAEHSAPPHPRLCLSQSLGRSTFPPSLIKR